jgi:uncharacterized membrane protein (UPF0127 family)
MSLATDEKMFVRANNSQEFVVGFAHSPLPRPTSPPLGIVAHSTNRKEVPHMIRCWGAVTPQERTAGLQFRHDLGSEDALLFVFPTSFYWPMWMLNTPMDLDVIFLDGHFDKNDGVATMRIVDIKRGAAFDTKHLSPTHPCNMVLEMRAGCFGFSDTRPNRGVRSLTMSGWQTSILRAIRSMPTQSKQVDDELGFFAP